MTSILGPGVQSFKDKSNRNSVGSLQASPEVSHYEEPEGATLGSGAYMMEEEMEV